MQSRDGNILILRCLKDEETGIENSLFNTYNSHRYLSWIPFGSSLLSREFPHSFSRTYNILCSSPLYLFSSSLLLTSLLHHMFPSRTLPLLQWCSVVYFLFLLFFTSTYTSSSQPCSLALLNPYFNGIQMFYFI